MINTMRNNNKSLLEEIKKVFGKYTHGDELSSFVRKIRSGGSKTGNSSEEANAHLLTDQLITFATEKLPILEVLELLKDLGKVYILRGDFVLAADVTRAMLAVALCDNRLLTPAANAFLSFSEVYLNQANWSEGITSLKKAYALFKKENDQVGLARCESLLGTIYAEKGQLATALDHFQKGYSFLRPSKSPFLVANFENNIGIVYNIRGEYDKAYTHFRRALVYFEKIKNNERVARVRHNIGMSLLKKKTFNAAVKEFDISINLASKGNHLPMLALSYLGKASIYCSTNDDSLAEAFADKGMEISAKIEDRLSIAEVYKIKGILERKRKHFALAQNYLFSSLRINKELENELNYAETAVELGILSRENGNKAEAQKYFGDALRYYKKIKAKDEIQKIKNFN